MFIVPGEGNAANDSDQSEEVHNQSINADLLVSENKLHANMRLLNRLRHDSIKLLHYSRKNVFDMRSKSITNINSG